MKKKPGWLSTPIVQFGVDKFHPPPPYGEYKYFLWPARNNKPLKRIPSFVWLWSAGRAIFSSSFRFAESIRMRSSRSSRASYSSSVSLKRPFISSAGLLLPPPSIRLERLWRLSFLGSGLLDCDRLLRRLRGLSDRWA